MQEQSVCMKLSVKHRRAFTETLQMPKWAERNILAALSGPWLSHWEGICLNRPRGTNSNTHWPWKTMPPAAEQEQKEKYT